jgi:hypothetical protein
LTGLVRDNLPAGVGFALRMFGHREAGSCRTDPDMRPGPLDAAQAPEVIAGIDAMNLAKTPLGRSIALAAEDLDAVTGRRVIVVVTDGEETCDGDPAAAIQRLRDLGWDLRLNIVELAIDDPSLAKRFRAWAALSNGGYSARRTGASWARRCLRPLPAPMRPGPHPAASWWRPAGRADDLAYGRLPRPLGERSKRCRDCDRQRDDHGRLGLDADVALAGAVARCALVSAPSACERRPCPRP